MPGLIESLVFPLQILCAAGGILLFAEFLIHLTFAKLSVKWFALKPKLRVLPPLSDFPSCEPVRFQTIDGLTLAGGIYLPEDGQSRGVVVFCPESGGSFETAANYTAPLVKAGFAVFSFSFRNESPSDSMPGYQSNYWLTQYEVDDVHAALDFIKSQPQFENLPISLMGVSRGAGAALATGAVRNEVQQIWTQGAFSADKLAFHHARKFINLGLGSIGSYIPAWHVRVTMWLMFRMIEWRNRCRVVRLESLLPRWRGRRVMFVSGSRDTHVPSAIVDSLCVLTKNKKSESRWVVPQAKHNMERVTSPVEFDKRIVDFFAGTAPVRATERRKGIAV
ncbi:alpha/beta hydrolase [Planctomicrobium sp. SH668]|uniref:alpha/beta hydrolase n=1 Tax=Planctomicrobium sp. SH668 TaxID=3448126 RepID=UPI003F5B63F6